MARILMVEDDANIREVYRTILEAAGHDVLEAADGQEGFRSVLMDEPDLVLLDLSLPLIDGDGLLKRLERLPIADELKVIVVTAHDRRVATSRIPEGTCRGLLIKPVHPDELVRTVHDCLEGRTCGQRLVRRFISRNVANSSTNPNATTSAEDSRSSFARRRTTSRRSFEVPCITIARCIRRS